MSSRLPRRLRAVFLGHPISPALEESLRREALASDLLRARVLAALFGVGLATAVLTRFTPGLPDSYAFGSRPSLTVIGFIAFLCLYEAAVSLWIRGRIDRGSLPRPAVWYLNAAIELTAPTLAMLVLAGQLDVPPFAVATPAVLAYFGFIALSTLRLDPLFSVFTGVLAALQYSALSVYLLNRFPPGPEVDALFSSIHFPFQRAVILTAVGVGCAFVSAELRRRVQETLAEAREKQRILTVFGQQTSPDVAAALLHSDPDDLEETRFVCVLFLDIRGFSTFAEAREPEAVVRYLNAFFDFAISAVHEHRGHVHQLLGDGFMSIFGAPVSGGNDCENAVSAALEILSRLDDAVEEGRLEPTSVGIGIHAGHVVAGSVGSALHREYKVTGDVVNVAARVEGITKELGARLLVTEAVWERLGDSRPQILKRTELEVRGRKSSVGVLRLA